MGAVSSVTGGEYPFALLLQYLFFKERYVHTFTWGDSHLPVMARCKVDVLASYGSMACKGESMKLAMNVARA